MTSKADEIQREIESLEKNVVQAQKLVDAKKELLRQELEINEEIKASTLKAEQEVKPSAADLLRAQIAELQKRLEATE
jgi:hypothetical protein